MFALFSSTVFLRVLNTDVSTFVETAVCAASALALASFAVVCALLAAVCAAAAFDFAVSAVD